MNKKVRFNKKAKIGTETIRCNFYQFKFILGFIILATNGLSHAQTGPGGVGSTTTNRFWLDASTLSFTNGAAVSTWAHNGGNTVVPDQTTTAYRPTMARNTVNGRYHGVVFDGTNDYLDFASNSDINTGTAISRTFFMAFRTGSGVSSRQVLFEEGGGSRGLNMYIFNGEVYVAAWNIPNDGAGSPWAFASIKASISANSQNILSVVYAGNTTTTGTITAFLNGTSIGTINNVGQLYAHNAGVLGGLSQASYYETGVDNSSGPIHNFNGTINEFIHFNYPINSAQRIIIANYLAAKYAQVLTSNDFYTMDNSGFGNFDHEAAGIGRVDASNIQSDSKGTGVIRINSATNLDNNEFMMWGHNGIRLDSLKFSDVPAGVGTRLERAWRVSERNAAGSSAVDVGSVNIIADLSTIAGFASSPASQISILIDTDNDGVFNDETPIFASSVSSGIFTFNAIAGLTDELRFTFGNTIVLPIYFTQFTLKCIEENVILNYSIETNKPIKSLTIEGMLNDNKWHTLKKIPNKPSGSFIIDYKNINTNILRLAATNFQGGIYYSITKYIECYKPNSNLYWVINRNNIKFFNVTDETNIQIYTLDGKLIDNLQVGPLLNNSFDINSYKNQILILKIGNQFKKAIAL